MAKQQAATNEAGTVEVFPKDGASVVHQNVVECEVGDGTLDITDEDGKVTHWSLTSIVKAVVTGLDGE